MHPHRVLLYVAGLSSRLVTIRVMASSCVNLQYFATIAAWAASFPSQFGLESLVLGHFGEFFSIRLPFPGRFRIARRSFGQPLDPRRIDVDAGLVPHYCTLSSRSGSVRR